VVKRRCVFLDRDGVINVAAAPGDYIRTWAGFRFIPGVIDWIRLFNALDLLVIVITNQRGVALELITEEALNNLHSRMTEELVAAGAQIDDIFCCIHDENTCECRKPQPGLILEAAQKWNIDLSQSIFIGDSDTDREAALRAGVRFVYVRNGSIQSVLRPPTPN
jgi:D-glycero-D-manno-heptose 1,7-bisphosphate phosphatase